MLHDHLLITQAERERIQAHYTRAMPYLEQHFGGTPVIAVTFPHGFGKAAVFHESFPNLPASISNVEARTSSGTHRFVALNAHNVTWMCAAHFVVELVGWGPRLDDPQRASFGRIVLSPHGTTTEDQVFEAAHTLADRLRAEGLQPIAVLDGFRGLTLWVPFSDGPDYVRMGAWFREFARNAADALPQTFTVENLRAERGDRIYLGTKSNHPGMGTLLPYAVRGKPALEVSLPVSFDQLGKVRNGEVTDAEFAQYIRMFGDVFASERTRIGHQAFGARDAVKKKHAVRPPSRTLVDAIAPRNYIITAALKILADGKPHDADDILAEGLKRGLLPRSTILRYYPLFRKRSSATVTTLQSSHSRLRQSRAGSIADASRQALALVDPFRRRYARPKKRTVAAHPIEKSKCAALTPRQCEYYLGTHYKVATT